MQDSKEGNQTRGLVFRGTLPIYYSHKLSIKQWRSFGFLVEFLFKNFTRYYIHLVFVVVYSADHVKVHRITVEEIEKLGRISSEQKQHESW